jgi:hypothetical protein
MAETGFIYDSAKVDHVLSRLANEHPDPAAVVREGQRGSKPQIWADGEYAWFSFGGLQLGRVPLEAVRMDEVPNEAR